MIIIRAFTLFIILIYAQLSFASSQKPFDLKKVCVALLSDDAHDLSHLIQDEEALHDQLEGFFGPRSMMWRVFRERALVVALPAAGVLQMAHPEVSKVLLKYSRLVDEPQERIQSTLRLMTSVIFGDVKTALRISMSVASIHTNVFKKTNLSPEVIDELFHWIYASTLYVMMNAYEIYVEQLSPAERQQLYDESKVWARLMGVKSHYLKMNLDEFTEYVENKANSFILSPETKEYLTHTLKNQNLPYLAEFLDRPFVPFSDYLKYQINESINARAFVLLPQDILNQLDVNSVLPKKSGPDVFARYCRYFAGERKYVIAYREAQERVSLFAPDVPHEQQTRTVRAQCPFRKLLK